MSTPSEVRTSVLPDSLYQYALNEGITILGAELKKDIPPNGLVARSTWTLVITWSSPTTHSSVANAIYGADAVVFHYNGFFIRSMYQSEADMVASITRGFMSHVENTIGRQVPIKIAVPDELLKYADEEGLKVRWSKMEGVTKKIDGMWRTVWRVEVSFSASFREGSSFIFSDQYHSNKFKNWGELVENIVMRFKEHVEHQKPKPKRTYYDFGPLKDIYPVKMMDIDSDEYQARLPFGGITWKTNPIPPHELKPGQTPHVHISLVTPDLPFHTFVVPSTNERHAQRVAKQLTDFIYEQCYLPRTRTAVYNDVTVFYHGEGTRHRVVVRPCDGDCLMAEYLRIALTGVEL